MALGIFMVGASSIFALFAVGAAAHRRAVDTSNAGRAAASIFAELEAKWTLVGDMQKRPSKPSRSGSGKTQGSDDEYPDPVAGEKPPWPVPGFPQYVYEVFYTPVDDEENAVMATLTIHWMRRGQNRNASFQRILLRRPF